MSVEAVYPRDEAGMTRLQWDVQISPRGSADATETVRCRKPSVIAAILAAMDQAEAKGWTQRVPQT